MCTYVHVCYVYPSGCVCMYVRVHVSSSSLSILLLQSFYAYECFACMCDCALAVCLGPAENRSGHQIPWIRSYRCCESLCRPWDWKSSLCCQHWPCLQPCLCPTTLALRQDFSLNLELSFGQTGCQIGLSLLELELQMHDTVHSFNAGIAFLNLGVHSCIAITFPHAISQDS